MDERGVLNWRPELKEVFGGEFYELVVLDSEWADAFMSRSCVLMMVGAKLVSGMGLLGGSGLCVVGLEVSVLVEGVLVFGVSLLGVSTRSEILSGECVFPVISLILLFIEGLG